jgi:hypothetical protein
VARGALGKKMLRKIRNGEEHLIANDPVRPHIPFEKRVGAGRDIFVLDDGGDTIRAVICVAYCNEVPTCENDMELWSQQAVQDGQHGSVAVFYTVWSYDKGAGREIVLKTKKLLEKETPTTRFVTLSPLTEMARKFHLRNGAKFVAKHFDCQNFEYV